MQYKPEMWNMTLQPQTGETGERTKTIMTLPTSLFQFLESTKTGRNSLYTKPCAPLIWILCNPNISLKDDSGSTKLHYYTTLYYTMLHCTRLYYTVSNSLILRYMILYSTILYYTIRYYTILYYTMLYFPILYHILPCCITSLAVAGLGRGVGS